MARIGMDWRGWFGFGIAGGVLLGTPLGCSDDGVPADGSAGTTGDSAETSVTDASMSATMTSGTTASTSISTSGNDTSGDSASVSNTTDDPSTGDGTSGIDSTSGTDTGVAPTVCVDDDDCALVDDCCTCAAIHIDDGPPDCPAMECKPNTCEAVGLDNPGVHCELGTCQLDEVDCNAGQVVCAQEPPECEDGFLPSVGDGCWTGACVPVEACDVVPSCDACPPEQTCIALLAKGPAGFLCSPIAPACEGMASCTCMAEVCMDPFSACIDAAEGMHCECAAC